MANQGPSPDNPYPMAGFPQVCYLKNIITRPNIEVGDYTYYDAPSGAEYFEAQVLYHFPFIGDWLRIGRFCALAQGVKFIMNGGNHAMGGGNPARVIRLRFEPAVTAALLEIAWWNWGIDKITRNLNEILAADVEVLRNCQ